MFVLFASLIDVLSSSLCIIEADDKPFGADLPVEVQNRIMWITKHAENLDGLTKVHKELKSRRICGLTDWVRVPKTYGRFHDPEKHKCPCERCNPEPLCHWCLLYAKNNISIDFMVLETKLQRLRDKFTMHDEEKYRQFERANITEFRDILLFTVMHLLLPMMVYMSPGNYQFNYKRIRSPNATFTSLSMAHVMLVEASIAETGATQFRNPRDVRVITLARARARYEWMKKQKQ